MRTVFRKNALFYILLIFILASCATLWLFTNYKTERVRSSDGTRDLRGRVFESGSYDLFGAVEFIPNELLTPEEFEERRDEIKTGSPEKEGPFGTSRLRVYLPEGTYGIMLWNAELATNIYFNGELAESFGQPGAASEQSVTDIRFVFYTVSAVDGVIEILQQASTHVVPIGESHSNIVIGKVETIRAIYDRQKAVSAILIGCFFSLALANLVLYSLFRENKSSLWFALFCFTWVVRTGYTSPWALSSFVPISGALAFRVSMLTIPVGILLFCLTIHELFDGLIKKRLRYSLYILCGAFAAQYLFVNMAHIFTLLPFVYAVLVIVSMYVIVRLFTNFRKLTAEQVSVFIGIIIFVFGVLSDVYRLYALPVYISGGSQVNQLTYNTFAAYALLALVLFQMTATLRGAILGFSVVKEAEQRLAMENAFLSRETKMREDMVRNLSHEVRIPLTVISTYAQLSLRQWRRGESLEHIVEGLDVINEEAKRIAVLASRTLALEEPDAGPVDLGDIVKQLARLLHPMTRNEGREITVNIKERLYVFCDEGEVTQIIWNLLDNALKYSGSGNIEVDGNIDDKNAYVIVSDDGVGIPSEILPSILERGVSGKGGTGIGLAISDGIAKKYGGRLEIESECGMGTRAMLILPAYGRDGGYETTERRLT